ncbi:MAG: lactonase family protein [Limisphaerales bacterium]
MTTSGLSEFKVGRVLALLLGCALAANGQTAGPFSGDRAMAGGYVFVYIGTYTGAKSKGIYASRLNLATGTLNAPDLVAETASPSYLAIHPNHRFLYAVNEVGQLAGKPGGAVSAFSIDPKTGKLAFLNQQTSGGPGPCHLAVDATGSDVLVANYSGGSVELLPIQRDGSLGKPTAFIQHQGSSVNPQRQEGPHAHCAAFDPANRLAFVCDLGLDKVLAYRFDPHRGTLVPNKPPWTSTTPGSGPRHLAFHPGGEYAYVINEIACTLTAFSYDASRGKLVEQQTLSTLPDGETVKPNYSAAEVQVHPSGRFVYGSNRGQDSIVVYAINRRTGKLTHVENQPTQGRTPRGFGVDPTGTYLLAANQDSDTVVVFRIDQKTGRLQPTGNTVEVGAPVCVTFAANW